MSKEQKQSPPQLFYFIILVFIVLVGLNFAGDYNLRESQTDDQVQANQDNVDFLIELAKTHESALVQQSNRMANNTQHIDLLTVYDKVITTQIGNIRSDIISKFPQASNVIDEGQKSITPTSPFLSLKMDKTEFVLGNIVIFTGTAHPNDAIQITLKDPDRILIPIIVSKTMIIDGSYTTNYTLRLDDPIGTWQVYARQQSDQTRTLSFTVE